METVYYSGLPYSYAWLMAGELYPESNRVSCNGFEEVFQKVQEDETALGVVPLENSTAGYVTEVFDLLVSYQVYLSRCKSLPIVHCLAGIPGSTQEEITEVHSHEQALLQSMPFLRSHGMIPKQEINTAVAAEVVAREGKKNVGAVCSKEAAIGYGLSILAEGINQKKNNTTRFGVIHKRQIITPTQKEVMVVFSCSDGSGALAETLGTFTKHGVNMTQIQSRPDGESRFQYLFYVVFQGNLETKETKELWEDLKEHLPFCRILGSY